MTRTLAAILIVVSFCVAAGEPEFRTDGGNDKLPWFQLKPSEFPPEGSAHYIAGELIELDHINRTGILRPDRTDAIGRAQWDIPMNFTLLPYGTLRYHGAPAELRDIPIGTHLHGLFYIEEKVGKDGKGAFDCAFRLEDDFSYLSRTKRAWRIDEVQLDKNKLLVTGVGPEPSQVDAKQTAFQIGPYTRVWKGRTIATLADLAPGQAVWTNLTVCTLKGPGRCTNVWIDEESRQVAAAAQLEVHRQFQFERGLPGIVHEVDNKELTVTVTLFAGFDPALSADFIEKDPIKAIVAEDSLRSYDQGSDAMSGAVLEIKETPAGSGNSGVRIKFKPNIMLEGFRPKRIIRVLSGKWKKDDIPKEERLYP